MDKKTAAGLLLAAAVIAALTLTPKQEAKNQATIRVSGAWALYPLMVRWADEYHKINPGVVVEVNAGGAGKGMADALSGLVDIGMISRDVDESEIERGAYPIRVAKDAVVPTANKNNPAAKELALRGLGRQRFVEVFVSGGDVKWGDLTGRPDIQNKVIPYVRSDSCGAAEIWAKFLGVKQEDLVGVGVNGDPGVAGAVSNDVWGLGFNNLNFAYDHKTGKPIGNLMVIPIDVNEDGKISGEEDFYGDRAGIIAAIADGRYPSPPARDLYIVTKNKPRDATADFILWILAEGQGYVAEEGYIPLRDEVVRDEAEAIR